MSVRRAFDEVAEAALEAAVRKIVAGEPFSLVGMAVDEAGELSLLKIDAEDDAQMISQARRALETSGAVAFFLVGTGQMMVPGEGPLDILIAYSQEPKDRKTLCRYASYEVYEQLGQPVFDMSDWFDQSDRIDPWLR
jgi:hypothetical protein